MRQVLLVLGARSGGASHGRAHGRGVHPRVVRPPRAPDLQPVSSHAGQPPGAGAVQVSECRLSARRIEEAVSKKRVALVLHLFVVKKSGRGDGLKGAPALKF